MTTFKINGLGFAQGVWSSGTLPPGLSLNPNTGLSLNPNTGAITGRLEVLSRKFIYREEPKGFYPHAFRLEDDSAYMPFGLEREIREWCSEQIGFDPTSPNPGGQLWVVQGGRGYVGLASETDAFAFKMRFG